MIMHLEIESTVIAAANPEGQVSFFSIFPIYHIFWNNSQRSGFENDQYLILHRHSRNFCHLIWCYWTQAQIRKYGLPAAWPNEDEEDRQALVVIEVSSSPNTPLNIPLISQYHIIIVFVINTIYFASTKKSSILFIGIDWVFNESITQLQNRES